MCRGMQKHKWVSISDVGLKRLYKLCSWRLQPVHRIQGLDQEEEVESEGERMPKLKWKKYGWAGYKKRAHLDRRLINWCEWQCNTARVTSMRMTQGWQTVRDLQPVIHSSNPILVLFSIRRQLPRVRMQAATMPRTLVKNLATSVHHPISKVIIYMKSDARSSKVEKLTNPKEIRLNRVCCPHCWQSMGPSAMCCPVRNRWLFIMFIWMQKT